MPEHNPGPYFFCCTRSVLRRRVPGCKLAKAVRRYISVTGWAPSAIALFFSQMGIHSGAGSTGGGVGAFLVSLKLMLL
jgi:hypothetical protein